ncbi:hypothetical protein BC739_006401 [Kutzneria viridogrisea]|uniref:Uncharacterized protein n=2 Tax=Kutzneria TaxID=43356 RepID=A0ABR6BQY3_9PSEU|nr:hypothetical protein [Kutzneria viridogrisea]
MEILLFALMFCGLALVVALPLLAMLHLSERPTNQDL